MQYNCLLSHGSICFANLHLEDLTERCYGFNHFKPVIRILRIIDNRKNKKTDHLRSVFYWQRYENLPALQAEPRRSRTSSARLKDSFFYLRFKSFIFAIKKDTALGVFFIGSGIRIRTLNNGVRVRCVTVTLYRYAHRVCYYNTICRNVNTEF